MNTIKKGSRGNDVKLLQRLLNLTDDGVVGPKTEAVVKVWQAANGLVADGIVGPRSWKKLADIYCVDSSVVYDPLAVSVSKSRNRSIKYIALHYTAGSKSAPGCAKAVKSVFESRAASADFAVDDKDIVQFNPDISNNYTWAVGDPRNTASGGASLYGICTNRNSISIEMCSVLLSGWSAKWANHEGWCFTERTIENARKIVRILMRKYNIPIENVVRHYDASGKLCPGVVGWNKGMIYNNLGISTGRRNNEDCWLQFKKSL